MSESGFDSIPIERRAKAFTANEGGWAIQCTLIEKYSLRSGANAAESATVFAALGDETRLRLVTRLCDGPQSITKLTEGTDVTRQAITKHLRVMEGAGLVRTARQGRESVWQLEPKRLEVARRYLDVVSDRWDAALGRLKAFVED